MPSFVVLHLSDRALKGAWHGENGVMRASRLRMAHFFGPLEAFLYQNQNAQRLASLAGAKVSAKA